jgi:hypothetical protein
MIFGLHWKDVLLGGDVPRVIVRFSWNKPTNAGKVRELPLLAPAVEARRTWRAMFRRLLSPQELPRGLVRHEGSERGTHARFRDLGHTCGNHLVPASWPHTSIAQRAGSRAPRNSDRRQPQCYTSREQQLLLLRQRMEVNALDVPRQLLERVLAKEGAAARSFDRFLHTAIDVLGDDRLSLQRGARQLFSISPITNAVVGSLAFFFAASRAMRAAVSATPRYTDVTSGRAATQITLKLGCHCPRGRFTEIAASGTNT